MAPGLRLVVATLVFVVLGAGPVQASAYAPEDPERPEPESAGEPIAGAPAAAWPIVYTYEVRPLGSSSDLEAFAAAAATTLADARGWGLGGSIRFERVASGGHFTVWLSSAANVPSFGPPCDSTYSCNIGRNVIINETRWWSATPSWNGAGGSLTDYRHMLVNHEVGHWLGFGHAYCAGAGQPAPVMQQQSISLQGCLHRSWPLDQERQHLAATRGVPILPAGPGPRLAALTNADGRLEIFAVSANATTAHTWQWGFMPGWSSWFGIGGPRPRERALAGGRNADGRLEVFATGEDGRLMHAFQWQAPGGWSGWHQLGTGFSSPPTVGQNADGRFEVFTTGTDGALRHTWQLAPNSGWSSPQVLATGVAHQPGVGWTADGRQAVFAVGIDGHLRGRIQVAPNGGWGAPMDLGGGAAGRPAVGRNADGRLEVFVRRTDGSLLHTWEAAPGGTWSALFAIGGAVRGSEAPAIGLNADGRLEVFAADHEGKLFHAWQAAQAGGWTPLFALGGSAAGPPDVLVNPDGRLEVFVVGHDGAVHHDYQLWAGGPWIGMSSLGRP